MFGAALPIAALAQTRSDPMPDNREYLAEASRQIRRFEAQPEAERLREASIALEKVNLVQEQNPGARAELRAAALAAWLHLLRLLDARLDPNFNREDTPMTAVQPPPTREGVQYPPGADPGLIDDAKARAEYEAAITANRQKAERYRLQVQLGPVAERLSPRAEAFIRASYSTAPADQAELRAAIDAMIQDPRRKARLRSLLAPPGR
jgi:hypothetical protein